VKYGRWKKEARRLEFAYFQARSRPVSVFVFGAAGDRITDDTAAIQATIDWVAAYGGGDIVLGEHHLIRRSIHVPDSAP
jgi:polygalacturonase